MKAATQETLWPESLLPKQHQGIHKEMHEIAEHADESVAAMAFEEAKSRLRNVNRWAQTAIGDSAVFQLCDGNGAPLERPAEEGDLVKIRVPGANRPHGTFDWVRLSQLREGTDPDGRPWILLTTLPIADPTAAADSTAHFFDDGSSGTFIICLNGRQVEGNHYGRNELPNTEGSLLEKARAFLVTIGAYLGMSDVQWRHLVRGLLGK